MISKHVHILSLKNSKYQFIFLFEFIFKCVFSNNNKKQQKKQTRVLEKRTKKNREAIFMRFSVTF
jgi:hypothetical protein